MTIDRAQTGSLARLWQNLLEASEVAIETRYQAPWNAAGQTRLPSRSTSSDRRVTGAAITAPCRGT